MEIRKKNLILSATTLGVFILAFLANDPFLLFENSYEKSSLLIDSKPDRVKKITVSEAGSVKIFTRTSDGWTIERSTQSGSLRADASKIDTQLKNLFDARRYQEVTASKEKFPEYEVRDSDLKLEMVGDSGSPIAQVILGKNASTGNNSFARLTNEEKVYSVKGLLRGDWNQDFNAYRDRAVLKLVKDNIKSIQASGSKVYSIKLDEKGKWIVEPSRAADAARINALLSEFGDLTGTRFIEVKPALPSFGKIIVGLGSNINKEIEFWGPTKEQEFIVRSSDNPAFLVLSKTKVDALFVRIEDLVEKNPAPNK